MKKSLLAKIVSGFLIVSVIALFIGSLGFLGVMRIDGHFDEVASVRLPSILGLEIINESQTCVDSAENALLCLKLDEAGRAEQYARIGEAWKRAQKGMDIYAPLPQTKEEEELWKRFVPAWDSWKKDHEKYISICKKFDSEIKGRQFDAVKDGHIYDAMVKQALVENGKTFVVAEDLLGKIIDLNIRVAEESRKKAEFEGILIQWLVGIISLLGVATAIGIGYSLAKSISNPIRAIVEQLTAGSEQTASAAGQVSTASQSLAEGASEQAASIEETSSSLEEMASMTRRNAENAERARVLAGEARSAAEQGAMEVKEMSVAMNEIKVSGDGVAKILKTIDEIAFQTNILALNAAVEAARAGEAGAGFAVVADEVRNLAQRCAQAAKETAQKIDESNMKSARGVEISQRVSAGLNSILEKARQVDPLVGEIATASQEQRQGVEQINLAISQMDKVTQSNAANAEETASASEELNAQAEMLLESVLSLNEVVEGSEKSAAGQLYKKPSQKIMSSEKKHLAKSKLHLLETNKNS